MQIICLQNLRNSDGNNIVVDIRWFVQNDKAGGNNFNTRLIAGGFKLSFGME